MYTLRRHKKSSVLIFLICLASWTSLSAHPHTFIDSTLALVMDDAGVKGIEISWLMDEMTSSYIIDDADRNKDGKLSASEIDRIRENSFSGLGEYHWFMQVKVDGKKLKLTKAGSFQARIIKSKLLYQFMVETRIPLGPKQVAINISLYDETMYTSFEFLNPDKVSIKDTRSPSELGLYVLKPKIRTREGEIETGRPYPVPSQEISIDLQKVAK